MYNLRGRCAAEANDLFGLVICPPLPNAAWGHRSRRTGLESHHPLPLAETNTGKEAHKKWKQLLP